jgi:hypothetical protein
VTIWNKLSGRAPICTVQVPRNERDDPRRLQWPMHLLKQKGEFSLSSENASIRASPVVLYRKPENRKRWKDVNCDSG